MPPKKQSKNAFFFFMLDYEKRQAAKGIRFPGGLKEVSELCSAEWQKMTPQQKGQYESRAKNAKAKDGLSGLKYTSQGVPITLIEKEAKLKQDFEDTMNDYIKVTVNQSDKRALMSKKFYFIHVNHLCRFSLRNGEGDFLPIEFAVTEFSLENGVENTYHELIDIDVPMGYTYDARQHAEETHKICLKPPGGQGNFRVMYDNLWKFLEPEIIAEQLPPLYTTRGLADIVPGLLTRMAKAGGRSVDIFKVYSIETLFFHMHNAAVAKSNDQTSEIGFPALSLAEKEILKDRFDRAAGIACEYHTEMDESAIHCSRSIVIRWVYIICDFCCLNLGIEMQPGKHCPFSTDVDAIRRSRENDVTQAMKCTKNENAGGLLSMTGVTEEHRVKTSERTYREELERRKNSQPLQIIDHSKLQNSIKQEVKITSHSTSDNGSTYSDLTRERSKVEPRQPYSKSWAIMGVASKTSPNIDETNFPSIGGRGAGFKKNFDNQFPPIGRGRGSPFSN